MTILGARLLESQRKVGETALAIELRQAGENCILADIAGNVSDSLDQVEVPQVVLATLVVATFVTESVGLWPARCAKMLFGQICAFTPSDSFATIWHESGCKAIPHYQL